MFERGPSVYTWLYCCRRRRSTAGQPQQGSTLGGAFILETQCNRVMLPREASTAGGVHSQERRWNWSRRTWQGGTLGCTVPGKKDCCDNAGSRGLSGRSGAESMKGEAHR